MDHESFEWRVIQEGSPRGRMSYFRSAPPLPRCSFPARGSPSVMADKHGQVPYVYLRVGCSSRVTRGAAPFLLLYFSPLFPSFFSFSSFFFFFFFFLERSGRWSLPRADLDVSAIRFRSKRDRPTGNLSGWPMIGR